MNTPVRKSEIPRIPLSECKKGYLYRLRSRNLVSGVYDGKEGFIGIREKFRHTYLFTEYHWEQGAPYGTAIPTEELCKVPEDIIIRERDPDTVDSHTKRKVEFDTPVADGGKGWFFSDTGESSSEIHPTSYENKPLYDWIEIQDKEMGDSV